MFSSHPPTQVTPITDFPVPAMNLASEELIRSQAKELKEEKILMQVRKLYNVRGISHVYRNCPSLASYRTAVPSPQHTDCTPEVPDTFQLHSQSVYYMVYYIVN